MHFFKGTGAELRIIGRLKDVPAIRKTQSGISVTNMSLVVYQSTQENEDSSVQWFDLTLWGKQAETLVQYAHAGMRVYAEVDAKNETEMVMGSDGVKHYFNTVSYHVKNYSFMDPIRLDEIVSSDAISSLTETPPEGEGAC
jgi:single-stranded DNA-binding protein